MIMDVHWITGCITRESTDVIVNTTTPNLDLANGFISEAILKAGGDILQEECDDMYPNGIRPGDIAVTQGGNLFCKYVFHVTLSNRWLVNQQQTEMNLQDIVETCLQVADDSGLTSISFPALGTGKLRYNARTVAQIMIDAGLQFHPKSLRELRFVINSAAPNVIKAFNDEFARRGSNSNLTGGGSLVDSLVMGMLQLRVSPNFPQTVHDVARPASHSKNSQGNFQQFVQEMRNTVSRVLQDHGIQSNVTNIFSQQQQQTPYNQQQQTPYNQQQQTPYNQQKRSLYNKQHQHQQMSPYNQQQLSPYYQQQMSPYSQQQLSPYYKQHVMPYYQKQIPTYGHQLMPSSHGYVPPNWTEDLTITLDLSSYEGRFIISELETAMNERILRVKRIDRIQNRYLYEQYQLQKKALETQNGNIVNEQRLWHGTETSSIRNINRNGFNRSYCDKNGTAFGKGVYFASDARQSIDHIRSVSHGDVCIYFVRVLTGYYTKGQITLIDTPVRCHYSCLRYDSVVDDISCPRTFVIFKDAQAYPEYLITLTSYW